MPLVVFAALGLFIVCGLLPQTSSGQALVEDRFSGTRIVDNTNAHQNLISFTHDGETELCFNSNTIAGDAELFCYNGSSVEQVAEINTRGSAAPQSFTMYDDGDGEKLYFSAVSGGEGEELHSYDGSTVQQVADLNPGSADSNPGGFTVHRPGGKSRKLFFSARDGTHGRELFSYDGSTVELAADLNSGSGDSDPDDITTYFCGTKGTWLYFEATNGSDGSELFYYDGSEIGGTNFGQFADIHPESSSYPGYLTVADVGAGRKLYFNASDGNNGYELYSYDCSSVSRETDINAGSNSAFVNAITVYDDGSGDKLYFRADNGTARGTYKYDNNGPTRISEIGKAEGVVYDGTLYFKGSNGSGSELYSYEGSGVSLVKDINPGEKDSDPMEHGYSTSSGSRAIYDPGSGSTLYFEAFDGEEDEQSARIRVLYTHDGSNTARFQNTNSTVAGPASERKVVYDGTLYFSASDAGEGNELYSYDGSSIDRVADIYSGPKASSPDGFVVYDTGSGPELYFAASDETNGRELRRYNGSTVERVTDINSEAGDASPTRPIEFDPGNGTKLFFGATNGSGEVGLYSTDGSSVDRIAKLGGSGRPPQDFALYDDGSGTALYFGAVGALYRYDGTSVTEVRAIAPRSLVTYDDGTGTKLYFSATQGQGRELARYDGSSVTEVKDIYSGTCSDDYRTFPCSSSPRELTVYDDGSGPALYFSARNGADGRELYRYDGSVAQERDLFGGAPGSNPTDLRTFNGRLYFVARTPSVGTEPRVFDGQSIQTFETQPGEQSGGGYGPSPYDPGGGTNLYITATNGQSGAELFRFQSSTLPVELVQLNGHLLESANGPSGSSVRINWKTVTETRNAGFDVQRRSGTEETWTTIGHRTSAVPDGASEGADYAFTDTDLPYAADTLHYRLRQIDTDGSATFSDEVVVERQTDALQLRAPFPNPAAQRVTVRFALPEGHVARSDVGSRATLRLYDMLGREVRTLGRVAESGRHKRAFDIGDLPSGVYVLRLEAQETIRTRKITVVQ